jgi:hypothetical protein
MKKILAAFSAALVALALGACTSTGAPIITLPNAQQQFETLCPIVNADLKTIGTSPLLNASQQAFVMNQVLPKNEAVCSAGAQLNLADAQTLANTMLPAVVTIVQAVPFPQQTAVELALQTFGPIALQLGEQIVATAQAASAPVAASAAQ